MDTNNIKPKILVGCPTSNHYEYCLKDYIEGVKALTYDNFDFLIVDNSKDDDYAKKISEMGVEVLRTPWRDKARDRIVESRNVFRDKVINEGYDYFLSLEQDVIPPVDVIERLLSHNLKIVTAVYFHYKKEFGYGAPVLTPVLFTDGGLGWNKIRFMRFEDVDKDGLIEVAGCGVGCVLMRRDVLERVRFRYDPEHDAFDDVYFSMDSKEHGFKIWCDTSVKCKHLVMKRPAEYRWDMLEK